MAQLGYHHGDLGKNLKTDYMLLCTFSSCKVPFPICSS